MSRTAILPTRRDLLGLAGAALLAPAAARADPVGAITGRAFGTTWQIVGPEAERIEELRREIEALFARIDLALSPWRPDSALSRLNAAPDGWQPAEGELLGVTTAALDLARDSGGSFDPTVGPLVARWGFGPIDRGDAPDWRGITVGENRIGKARAGLTLDLCGIAKGRALDLAADLARRSGRRDLLLDLGGELLALGRHPSGRPWRVGVEAPVPVEAAPAALALPPGLAVATSGLRAQSYALGGRRWGHIIDPAARQPVAGALRSVTVLSRTAMDADGWATALFAAGDEAGPALARARGVSALLVSGEAAPFRLETTGDMARHLL